MGAQVAESVNNLTIFLVVYSEGNAAVRQDPSTENARTKIITMGRIKKTVEINDTPRISAFIAGFVTR